MALADTVLQTPDAELVTACTGLEVLDQSDQPLVTACTDLEVLDQSDQPLVTTEHTAVGVATVVAHDEVIG